MVREEKPRRRPRAPRLIVAVAPHSPPALWSGTESHHAVELERCGRLVLGQ